MNEQSTWKPAAAPRNETLIGYPGNPDGLQRAKELGVNSIAVGISWGRAEAVEGKWDFARVEAHVREILSHGLLWVPQLNFTTNPPQWFLDKGFSVKQKCVEHG